MHLWQIVVKQTRLLSKSTEILYIKAPQLIKNPHRIVLSYTYYDRNNQAVAKQEIFNEIALNFFSSCTRCCILITFIMRRACRQQQRHSLLIWTSRSKGPVKDLFNHFCAQSIFSAKHHPLLFTKVLLWGSMPNQISPYLCKILLRCISSISFNISLDIRKISNFLLICELSIHSSFPLFKKLAVLATK